MQQILQARFGRAVRVGGLAVFSAAVFVFGLAFALPTHAAVTITSATVDGSLVAAANQGSSISVEVDASTNGSGTADDWKSTAWRVGSGSFTCVNTSNHTNDGSYDETFNITAPSVYGVYNVEFVAYNGETCDSGASNTSTLTNAVKVYYPPTAYDSGDFNNPSRVLTANNSYADMDDNGDSQVYKIFNLPTFSSGITIDGIEVDLGAYREGTSAKSFDVSVSWDGGTNFTSVKNTGDLGTVQDRTIALGGSSDVWGRTWSSTDFINANFKVKVTAVTTGSSDLNLDYLQVMVYYTEDTTAPIVTQVTPVTTPTNDTTPSYTFNLSESGTIYYGGDCANETAPGAVGNNTVTFGTLAPGVYSNCTIQVADASANTSTVLNIPSFTIDTTAPVINSLAAITAEATSSAGVVVDYTLPTATDNVDVSVTVSCSPDSGTVFALGTNNVTCSATDAAGNAATPVVFSVTVQDTTGPVIDSPVHSVAEATGPDGAVATYSVPNAVDAVDGTFPSTCLPASGSLFPLGTTVVDCNAIDFAGNTAMTVGVNVLVRDTTDPVITLNGSNIINLFIGDTYTELGATATDVVDGDVTTTNNIVITGSVNTAAPGTNVLTYNVSDAAGNAADSVQRFVFVSDNTAPVINPVADMTVEAASALNTAVDYGTITATDDVDGTFNINSASCLPLSGSDFPIGTTVVNCNATDSSGNIGFGAALSVTVQDTTAPIITITPNSQTVEATSASGAAVSFDVAVSDAVDTGVGFSLVCSATSGAMFQIGTTVVTCTANDETGNYTTSTATIIVVDTVPPLSFAPADQTFEATGFLTSPELAIPAISDLIDPSPVLTYTPSSSFPLGTTVVTWTATDFSGNIMIASSNVTIIDTTAPVITLNGDDSISLTVGDSYVEQGATVTDNHDIEISVVISGTVNTSVAGTYTITYNAHDVSGNNAVEKTRTVVVNSPPSSGGSGGSSFVEPTPPSFGNQPITVGGGLGGASIVQLVFDVQNASWMAISETPDFTNVSWVPYATSTTSTISASNTERKLYIKFRRVNGGETEVREVVVLPNTPSTLIQAVLGVRITRLSELLAKLKFGDRGDEVVELQSLLKEAGYFPAYQVATGYFGPITQAAVNKALTASKAVLGVKISRVDELVAKLKFGDRGEEVVELQSLLKEAGYFPAYQAATGYFGPITKASIDKYLAATK